MPFQRFPSAERASEFPCVCDTTGENMRKPDNAENTRGPPDFRFPCVFRNQLRCAVKRRVFPKSTNITLTHIYDYRYVSSASYIAIVSLRELWKFRELGFSKSSLAVAKFYALYVENFGLINLYMIKFLKLETR